MGLVVPKTRDGRVLFFLPWEGMTICGTTDAPSDITMTPSPTQDDVTFIIEESNRYLNRTVRHAACLRACVRQLARVFDHHSTLAHLLLCPQIKPTDVKAAWSGIRPLVKDPAAKSTSQVSRKVRHATRQAVAVALPWPCARPWHHLARIVYARLMPLSTHAVLAARGGGVSNWHGVDSGRQVDHLPQDGRGRRRQGETAAAPRTLGAPLAVAHRDVLPRTHLRCCCPSCRAPVLADCVGAPPARGAEQDADDAAAGRRPGGRCLQQEVRPHPRHAAGDVRVRARRSGCGAPRAGWPPPLPCEPPAPPAAAARAAATAAGWTRTSPST